MVLETDSTSVISPSVSIWQIFKMTSCEPTSIAAKKEILSDIHSPFS